MKLVELYTDGACLGNPGPGGWAALLRYQGHEKLISGNQPDTTNNRMELLAVIQALELLKEPCRVEVFTDSQYLQKAFQERWLQAWQKNGWVTRNRTPVKNRDLWDRLLQLSQRHQVHFHWIKGHADCAENRRVDKEARRQAQKTQKEVK
ncbi:MAG: ribonuclease HI [Meiothermus sp.]|nr:ribonuclease HI [Meiothermus sp.]